MAGGGESSRIEIETVTRLSRNWEIVYNLLKNKYFPRETRGIWQRERGMGREREAWAERESLPGGLERQRVSDERARPREVT